MLSVGVYRVDLADHGLGDLLDLVGAGDGELDALHTELLELGRRQVDLQLGVGLRRAVEQADLLGIRGQAVEQRDLIGDGIHIRRSGDVAAGHIVILDQSGGREVGDGGADHGDIRGGARHGLGRGRADGQDEVAALVHELARDGLAGRLVVLGVLLADGGPDSRLLDGRDEALVRRIERRVLGELQDADLEGGVAVASGARV